MKSTAIAVVALAGIANAAPAPKPQFSIPGGFSIPAFSIPAFSFPSLGGGLPTGLPGGGLSLPTGGFGGSVPTGGLSLPTGGLSLPTGGIGLTPSSAAAIPSATGTIPTTTATSIGNVRADCTAQGSGGGDTESGVKNKNCCTDLTVIFARGTSETGNVGTIAGPPMFKSIRSKLGADRVTVQGVDYAADIAGNANLGASGGPEMASDVKAALSNCPNTTVVVSGYSQGAMVVHNAFSSQGLTASQVKGAVLFGDPLKSQSVGSLATANVKEFCASGDSVCELGSGIITPAHLTYGDDADEAAAFVIQVAGLS